MLYFNDGRLEDSFNAIGLVLAPEELMSIAAFGGQGSGSGDSVQYKGVVARIEKSFSAREDQHRQVYEGALRESNDVARSVPTHAKHMLGAEVCVCCSRCVTRLSIGHYRPS